MTNAQHERTGGFAFPVATDSHCTQGMTLRDWFAGQALVGYLSAPGTVPTPAEAAEKAYRYADAMLAQRKG